jgi:hypothetical protein
MPVTFTSLPGTAYTFRLLHGFQLGLIEINVPTFGSAEACSGYGGGTYSLQAAAIASSM